MATCFSTAFLNHHDSYTTLVDSNFPPNECAFLYPIGDENASLLPMSVILTGNRF